MTKTGYAWTGWVVGATLAYQLIAFFRQQSVSIFELPDDSAQLSNLQLKAAHVAVLLRLQTTKHFIKASETKRVKTAKRK